MIKHRVIGTARLRAQLGASMLRFGESHHAYINGRA